MINVPAQVTELAVCQIIKNGTILLLKSNDGINKDKWNSPSGEVAQKEPPRRSAMKHLFQQTGLYSSKVTDHGTVRLFLNGSLQYSYRLHIFSTRSATGELKPNIAGEAKWYNIADIPYYEMWADDRYWLPLVLQGKSFDADFFFDEKNEKITKYQIRERQNVLKKVAPVIILIAIIAAVIFLVAGSGVLSRGIALQAPPGTKNTIKTSNSVNTITNTVITTTIMQNFTTTGPPTGNGTYIYYIKNAGTPSQTQVYYSVANSSGIVGWKRIYGYPISIINAQCTVYTGYTYCTGGPAVAESYSNETTGENTTNNTPSNMIRIGNPACLAIKPNDSDCYNYYPR